MVIKWQKHNEHTPWGLFKVGDVIDTAARGIPDEVAGPWIRDGYAVEANQEPEPAPEARPRTARRQGASKKILGGK